MKKRNFKSFSTADFPQVSVAFTEAIRERFPDIKKTEEILSIVLGVHGYMVVAGSVDGKEVHNLMAVSKSFEEMAEKMKKAGF